MDTEQIETGEMPEVVSFPQPEHLGEVLPQDGERLRGLLVDLQTTQQRIESLKMAIELASAHALDGLGLRISEAIIADYRRPDGSLWWVAVRKN